MTVWIDVELEFKDDSTAKKVVDNFKKVLKKKKNCSFLEVSLFEYLDMPITDREKFMDEGYIVIDSKRFKNQIIFNAMNNKPRQHLKDIARDLAKLGSLDSKILEVTGKGVGREYYLIGNNFVNKSDYEKHKFGASTEELKDSNFFLPEGRVDIEAYLTSWKYDSDGGYVSLLNFETEDGKKFIFRGSSSVFGESHDKEGRIKISLNSGFELKKHRGKLVSMAHRPMRIKVL